MKDLVYIILLPIMIPHTYDGVVDVAKEKGIGRLIDWIEELPLLQRSRQFSLRN